jgi:predicted nucleic acid-binding protein
MSFVLDSSVTLAWLFVDELTPEILRLSEMASETTVWVPGIWRLEVANSLLMGVRRGRIDAAFRASALADLSMLDIAVDAETDAQAWTATSSLAERFRLTLYDACYLELAQRRALPLASLDNELRAAAQALQVPLLC